MKEIIKMPILVEHFYDHIEENKNTNLFSFLISHYFIEDGTDSDAAEDNKLPFKSVDQIYTIQLSSLTPPVFTFCLKKLDRIKKDTHILRDENNLPNQYLDTIWQPPRFC